MHTKLKLAFGLKLEKKLNLIILCASEIEILLHFLDLPRMHDERDLLEVV